MLLLCMSRMRRESGCPTLTRLTSESGEVKGVNTAEVSGHADYSVNVIEQSESPVIQFSGFGMSSNDKVWIVEQGADCVQQNAVKVLSVSESATVRYAFTVAESEKRYDVCYVFYTFTLAEAPIKYDNLALTVRSVPTVAAAVPALAANGAVVDQPKVFTMDTAMAGEGDALLLVNSPSNDCLGEVMLEVPVAQDKTATVTLTNSTANSWTMCYVFAEQTRAFLVSDFVSKEVLEMVPADTNSTHVTANVVKEWLLTVNGGSNNDKAKMVTGDNCDMGEWVPVVDGVVSFALEYVEEDYKLCYLFDGEEPMMYPEIRLSVLHVNEITIDDGARNDAIIFKVDNAIRITGMTFPGDKIYPLANPLNEPVTAFTSSDCLEDIPLDEYIARSEDGAFHVSVVTGGSVLICYLFEGETKPTLTSFNLLVLGVINPTVSVGEEELIGTANLWAVKNVTTQLSFQSSDTVHEARYKWVASDAADCDAPGEGMEYDADGSRALLYDAEYERMYDEFTLTNTTTENYKLCYQFSGKRWVFLSEQSQGDVYPPLTLESRGLLDILSVDESSPFEFVPREEKQWMVVVANGKENDKMRLVTGISCMDREQIVATADVQGYLVVWNTNEDSYEKLANTDRLAVCYGFTNADSNFWVLYEEFEVDVMFVNQVTSMGNRNLIYVNQTKEYTLHGANIDRLEEVFFVELAATCASAERFGWTLVEGGQAVVLITQPVQSALKMCVVFKNHVPMSVTPQNQNILEVSVVSVEAMQSLEGFASGSSVMSQSKQFRLLGSHTELVQSAIFANSPCDDVFEAFPVSEGSFSVYFETHTEGRPLTLCVKYPQENPIDTGITMELKALTKIDVDKGDKRVLIWGTSKTFTFSGYGLNAEEDTAEFILATSVANDSQQ